MVVPSVFKGQRVNVFTDTALDLRGPFAAALGQFTQLLSAESPLKPTGLEGLFQYQRAPGQQHHGKTDALGLIAGGGTDSVEGIMGLADASSRVWARSSGVVFIDSLVSQNS